MVSNTNRWAVGPGFSRLVLEHKVRPNRRLAAAFATRLQPSTVGGLAGLLLRLSQVCVNPTQVVC